MDDDDTDDDVGFGAEAAATRAGADCCAAGASAALDDSADDSADDNDDDGATAEVALLDALADMSDDSDMVLDAAKFEAGLRISRPPRREGGGAATLDAVPALVAAVPAAAVETAGLASDDARGRRDGAPSFLADKEGAADADRDGVSGGATVERGALDGALDEAFTAAMSADAAAKDEDDEVGDANDAAAMTPSDLRTRFSLALVCF